MTTYCAYALIEIESGERFNFHDYPTYTQARAQGDRLGKIFSFTLQVYGIDTEGRLHPVEVAPC